MKHDLEDMIDFANATPIRSKVSFMGYLAAAVVALTPTYIGCGGEDNSCDSDYDCKNGQECGEQKCSDNGCGQTVCHRECVTEGEKLQYDFSNDYGMCCADNASASKACY